MWFTKSRDYSKVASDERELARHEPPLFKAGLSLVIIILISIVAGSVGFFATKGASEWLRHDNELHSTFNPKRELPPLTSRAQST
jgi:hypothetical protein